MEINMNALQDMKLSINPKSGHHYLKDMVGNQEAIEGLGNQQENIEGHEMNRHL